MKNITITIPTPEDIPLMRKWGEENKELHAYEGSSWHSEKALRDWITNPKDDLILVAKVDDKTVGMCMVYVLREWAYCSALFVKKGFRKMGIGKLLLKHAYAHVDKKGIRGLHLVTNKAVDFYTHLGFTKRYTFTWMRKNVKEKI